MCEYGAELELAEAAFGNSFSLISHDSNEIVFEILVDSLSPSQSQRGSLRFVLHHDFPKVPLRCSLNGTISNSKRESINHKISSWFETTPEIGVLSVYQAAVDLISDYTIEERKIEPALPIPSANKKIARFLIYFHHIMSTYKRKVLVENAIDLNLGGYSKPGFPGIVVVEGLFENVLEYVRRTQRLRWQQMVVRGEEIEPIESDNDEVVDSNRKFPKHFMELEGNMSDMAAACQEANMHDLFMTALKKTHCN